MSKKKFRSQILAAPKILVLSTVPSRARDLVSSTEVSLGQDLGGLRNHGDSLGGPASIGEEVGGLGGLNSLGEDMGALGGLRRQGDNWVGTSNISAGE